MTCRLARCIIVQVPLLLVHLAEHVAAYRQDGTLLGLSQDVENGNAVDQNIWTAPRFEKYGSIGALVERRSSFDYDEDWKFWNRFFEEKETRTLGCYDPVNFPTPRDECPSDCPYWAETESVRQDDWKSFCNFQCVKPADCGKKDLHIDESESVADRKTHHCRSCSIVGCAKCASSGNETCIEAALGYSITDDGKIESRVKLWWNAIFGLIGLLVLIVILWYIELLRRPILNQEGLDDALRFRTGSKLRLPGFIGNLGDGYGAPYPLRTNLWNTDVAGPGLKLFFNYQLAVIIWASGVLLYWLYYCAKHDVGMISFGTKPTDTPVRFCHRTSRYANVVYLDDTYRYRIYLWTCAASMGYAAYQHWCFDRDNDKAQIYDFAAMIKGLPPMHGSEKVEDTIRKLIETKTDQKVVGVSVAWDYTGKEEDVRTACEKFIVGCREENPRRTLSMNSDIGVEEHLENRANHCANIGFLRKQLRRLDGVLGVLEEHPETASTYASDEELIQDRVKNFFSTDTAFVVFETEIARDEALRRCSIGIDFRNHTVNLKQKVCQPCNVCWDNFGSERSLPKRIIHGVSLVAFSMLAWTVLFYTPFAIYMSSFSYAYGALPAGSTNMFFSMLVVAGNQIMYLQCMKASRQIRFKFDEDREVAYMLLYKIACVTQLILDMFVMGHLAYASIENRNGHANKLFFEQQSSFQEIVKSYPMQQALGFMVFRYAFPSTFLFGFCGEPFAWLVPWHLNKLITRSNPLVRGRSAQLFLDSPPMDLSRYADIQLNIGLVAISFFFPSGWWIYILVTFVVCHILVLVFDHIRVLRAHPRFYYATSKVESASQAMMAIPCGIMLSSLGARGYFGNLSSDNRWFASSFALFFGHLLVHWLFLFGVLPMLERRVHKPSSCKYSDVAIATPDTWFSTNPVHCLRSKYVYEDSPPCSFYVRGNEYLMQANPEIGVFFAGAQQVRESTLRKALSRPHDQGVR